MLSAERLLLFVLCFRWQFLPRSLFWLAKMLQQSMMSWQSLKTSRMTLSECLSGRDPVL